VRTFRRRRFHGEREVLRVSPAADAHAVDHAVARADDGADDGDGLLPTASATGRSLLP
jgi:hypothetical protein